MMLELVLALATGALLCGSSLYIGVLIQRRAQAPALGAKDKTISELSQQLKAARKDFDSLLNRAQADSEQGFARLEHVSAARFSEPPPSQIQDRHIPSEAEKALLHDEYGRFDSEVLDPMHEALNG
jgi:hypothetical protein